MPFWAQPAEKDAEKVMTVTGSQTALNRKGPSVPVRRLVESGRIGEDDRVLDYGCGRGADVRYLKGTQTLEPVGYDPAHWPLRPVGDFDVVLCTYVLNVVTKEDEYQILWALRGYRKRGGKIYVTVRRDLPREGKEGRGCFQRYVELQAESVWKTAGYETYLL